MKDVMVFYTTVSNVILSILRSQMDFCTMEIHLGYQNRQDYISKGCKTYCNILHSSEFHISALKEGLTSKNGLARSATSVLSKYIKNRINLNLYVNVNLTNFHFHEKIFFSRQYIKILAGKIIRILYYAIPEGLFVSIHRYIKIFRFV